MGLYEVPLSMSLLGFGMGTMLSNFHMCGIMLCNILVISHIENLEVVNIIMSLNNRSPGWDAIPYLLTIRVLNSYIKSLTFLINQSFMK